LRLSPIIAAGLLALVPCSAAEFLVYAGTHTGHGSKGIYAWRFQTANAKLTPLGVAAETGNPSFLVEHPNHKVLYAVNENGDGAVLGSVSAFAIDAKSGKLTALNWVSSRGGAPCYLAIDRSGKWLAVGNGAGASIAILPIQGDGRLGEAVAVEQRAGAHARSLAFSPDRRFLGASDVGVSRFDATKGSLARAGTFPAAAGPIAFHPDGSVLYAVDEKTSNLTMFQFDTSSGTLRELETESTMREGAGGPNPASAIAVNASGTVLYIAMRNLNVLAQFAIDAAKHTLTPMEYPPVMGRDPRYFAIDPTGGFLFSANQDSGNVTVFRVHPHTGQLQPARAIGKNVPNASCVVFVPVG
jgi:6-phosphogluconolactonase